MRGRPSTKKTQQNTPGPYQTAPANPENLKHRFNMTETDVKFLSASVSCMCRLKCLVIGAIALTILAAACGGSKSSKDGEADSRPAVIHIDGSSTVFPITEAVAEEVQKKNTNLRPTVGISGTGGGFQKFCRGETDINDASRPITKTEFGAWKKGGIEVIQLPIAFHGPAGWGEPKKDRAGSMRRVQVKTVWWTS